MKKFDTHTNDTFTTADGKTARYEDVFKGIAKNVEIYGAGSGKGMSKEDLEDTFQDAAYKAVRSHGCYDTTVSAPQTYGSRIAGNCEKDAYRKAEKRKFFFSPLEEKDENGEDTMSPKVTTACGRGGFEADSDVETNEALEYIEAKMGNLDEKLQEVLRMHLDGLKPAKMAAITGKTPGAMSTLLFRARKALARELGKEFLSEYGLCA